MEVRRSYPVVDGIGSSSQHGNGKGAKPFKKPVSCVILDLDGTLLNTDVLQAKFCKCTYIVQYGKQWDGSKAHRITPYEAAAIVEDYELPITTDELLFETVPIFSDKYLEVANRLEMDTSSCLLIEDSLPGVTASKAAGMQVVAVPSVPKQSHVFTSAHEVANSILDLQLEKWGLLAFDEEGTLPIEPWQIGGPVVKGFGRGLKVLEIPTGFINATVNYP
ncbi:hypothetical protein OROGR_003188 [Orobanche gracilis]